MGRETYLLRALVGHRALRRGLSCRCTTHGTGGKPLIRTSIAEVVVDGVEAACGGRSVRIGLFVSNYPRPSIGTLHGTLGAIGTLATASKRPFLVFFGLEEERHGQSLERVCAWAAGSTRKEGTRPKRFVCERDDGL